MDSCKTSIHRFKSDRHLPEIIQLFGVLTPAVSAAGVTFWVTSVDMVISLPGGIEAGIGL